MLQLCDCHKSLNDLWDLSDMSRSFPSRGPRGNKKRHLELMEWGWSRERNKNAPTYRMLSVNLWSRSDGWRPEDAHRQGNSIARKMWTSLEVIIFIKVEDWASLNITDNIRKNSLWDFLWIVQGIRRGLQEHCPLTPELESVPLSFSAACVGHSELPVLQGSCDA